MSTEEEIKDSPTAEVSDAEKVASESGGVSIKEKQPKVPLPSSLQSIVGALLFASKTPLSATELRNCIRSMEGLEEDDQDILSVYKSCTGREIEEALRGLEKDLARAPLGFRLVCTAGTYRLQTDPTCGRYVRALLKLDRPNRLTRASLETLAIIAYRQPISKSEIEQIRGVTVDTIVKTLVELQLVRIVGRSELPGHPFLYGTTQLFLEHFGLASLQQLNELDPTLQRSNPRERAAAYKKPEKKEPELSLENPSVKEPEEEKKAEESPVVAEAADAAEEGLEEVQAAAEPSVTDDDDDVYIDDTPDEFDDEDDDDDFEDDDFDEDDGDEE